MHGLDQHHVDLLQVMVNEAPLIVGQRLDTARPGAAAGIEGASSGLKPIIIRPAATSR